MRRKFWNWVHDRLEDAWHWVYYHKLAEPLPEITPKNYRYTFSYVVGRASTISPDLGTETVAKAWSPENKAMEPFLIDHCPKCGEYLHDEQGHSCP